MKAFNAASRFGLFLASSGAAILAFGAALYPVETSARVEMVLRYFAGNPFGNVTSYEKYRGVFNDVEYTIQTYTTNRSAQSIAEEFLAVCESQEFTHCNMSQDGAFSVVTSVGFENSEMVFINSNGGPGATFVTQLTRPGVGAMLDYSAWSALKGQAISGITAEHIEQLFEVCRENGVPESIISSVRAGEVGIMDLAKAAPASFYSPEMRELLEESFVDKLMTTVDTPGQDFPDVPRVPGSTRVQSLFLDNDAQSQLVAYASDLSPSEIITFYKSSLQAEGWKDMFGVGDRMQQQSKHPQRHVMFAKEGQVLMVTFSQVAGRTVASLLRTEKVI